MFGINRLKLAFGIQQIKLAHELESSTDELAEIVYDAHKYKWRHDQDSNVVRIRLPWGMLIKAWFAKTSDGGQNGLELLAKRAETFLRDEKKLLNVEVQCRQGHIVAQGFVNRNYKAPKPEGTIAELERALGSG